MRILGIDFETAGTRQTGHFRAVEVGMALLNTDTKRIEFSAGYLVNDLLKSKDLSPHDIENHFEIPEEVSKIHKLTLQDVFKQGRDPLHVFSDIILMDTASIDAIMVWNGYFFDRPLLFDLIARNFKDEKSQTIEKWLREISWIDLKHDMNFKNKLDHEAADKGILSAYPHMALADVITMFKLYNTLQVDENWLVNVQGKSPFAIVKAKTTYEEREKPKKEN